LLESVAGTETALRGGSAALVDRAFSKASSLPAPPRPSSNASSLLTAAAAAAAEKEREEAEEEEAERESTLDLAVS
jgi:ribosomal protein L12E/L44/L45/RPP1/RPP2